jgi:hypothetical protein
VFRFRPGHAVPVSVVTTLLMSAALVGPDRVVAQTATPAPPKTTPAAPPKKATPAPAAKGAAAPEALPAARTIVDRHLAAVGGRKAIMSHSSTRASGTVTIAGSGLNGTFELFSAKPNLALLKISIGGIGEVVEGFDGTVAWNKSAMTGPMLSQGKELEQKRFDADYYADLHESSRYLSMTTLEKTVFDGRSCYKISLKRKDGGEDFDFYEVASGLKAGTMATRETPMGAITATQVVTDYKKFGDVLQPSVVKQTAMGVQQVLTFTSIEYDKVDPAVFALPAEIKALVK